MISHNRCMRRSEQRWPPCDQADGIGDYWRDPKEIPHLGGRIGFQFFKREIDKIELVEEVTESTILIRHNELTSPLLSRS